jgi:inner membrane transporter RhtA
VIAMCVAAVLVTGPGVAAGAPEMFRPAILATGAAIGVLSSVVPYWLELEVLRRVPTRVFGVWMSLEPAVAALIGLAILGQRLSLAEWGGICCVVIASAGAARGGDPPLTQALPWGACLPGLPVLRPRCFGRPRHRCAGSRSPR